MNDIQTNLLNIIRASLFKETLNLPSEIEWSALYQEAMDQTVVGLAIPVVKQLAGGVEVPNLTKWTDVGDQLRAYYMRCFYAQKELIKLFEDNGIPIVIVKGYAAAVYYPVNVIRTMGDIDFLVEKDRYEESQALMKKFGYQELYGADSDDSRHVGYVKNNIVYELHWSLSSFGVDIDSIIEQGMKNHDEGVIGGVSFPMLPPIENGLVLLTHIRQHLLEEEYGLGLRQIIDWMMYVNKYSGTKLNGFDWDEKFLSIVQLYGMDTLAITLTFICQEWLGLNNAPSWCEKASKNTAEEFIDMIMSYGNFGRKLDRDNRSVKDGIVIYRKEGLFKRLHYRGINNWKAAQKHRILRPFAWIYQGFRVIGLSIESLFSNKRGIKQISDGYKKSNLLKRLGI